MSAMLGAGSAAGGTLTRNLAGGRYFIGGRANGQPQRVQATDTKVCAQLLQSAMHGTLMPNPSAQVIRSMGVVRRCMNRECPLTIETTSCFKLGEEGEWYCALCIVDDDCSGMTFTVAPEASEDAEIDYSIPPESWEDLSADQLDARFAHLKTCALEACQTGKWVDYNRAKHIHLDDSDFRTLENEDGEEYYHA